MAIRWADMDYGDEFYKPFDENQRAVRGSLLVQLGVDLEDLDPKLFEPCEFFDREGKEYSQQ